MLGRAWRRSEDWSSHSWLEENFGIVGHELMQRMVGLEVQFSKCWWRGWGHSVAQGARFACLWTCSRLVFAVPLALQKSHFSSSSSRTAFVPPIVSSEKAMIDLHC